MKKKLQKAWQILGSFLLALMVCITVPLWVMMMILLAGIPHRWMFYWMHAWGKVMRFFLWSLCGITLKVEEWERISQHAVIYFVKHQSTFETFVLPGLLPFHTYVLKQELLKLPFFGWGLRLLRVIAIDRTQGVKSLKAVIAKGKARLAKGCSIVIFPEGTRVAVNDAPEFHKSGALLARGVGCDIIPIAHNAGLLWPKGTFLKKRGTVTVCIGAPISSQGVTLDELNQTLYHWMRENTARLCEGSRTRLKSK